MLDLKTCNGLRFSYPLLVSTCLLYFSVCVKHTRVSIVQQLTKYCFQNLPTNHILQHDYYLVDVSYRQFSLKERNTLLYLAIFVEKIEFKFFPNA